MMEDYLNVYPNSYGQLRQIGYKNFSDLQRVLKKVNRNCKKYGFETEIRIKFPIGSGRTARGRKRG